MEDIVKKDNGTAVTADEFERRFLLMYPNLRDSAIYTAEPSCAAVLHTSFEERCRVKIDGVTYTSRRAESRTGILYFGIPYNGETYSVQGFIRKLAEMEDVDFGYGIGVRVAIPLNNGASRDMFAYFDRMEGDRMDLFYSANGGKSVSDIYIKVIPKTEEL